MFHLVNFIAGMQLDVSNAHQRKALSVSGKAYLHRNVVMKEIQKILDITFPFVETLLNDYREFYPLVSVVKLNGTVDQVTKFKGDNIDFPDSVSVLENLKNELRSKHKDFIAISIFYDVKLPKKQSDAVAIYVETKEENSAYTFFYTYKFEQNELVFTESWKILESTEILKD